MSKSKKKTITASSNIEDVRKACQQIGDSLKVTYDKTKDVRVAYTAVNAYSKAIHAVKVQLIYKKLTGNPQDIEFLK
jgi:hypothetical protein